MIRLIHEVPMDGPANMARDEALLIAIGESSAPPTLRLYEWNTPTISLGYFQKYADYLALPPPAGGLPVVRRLTGGGAILHDLELTYSLTLPMGHELLRGGPNRLYELAHDAVIASLGELNLQSARCGVTDDSGAARGPFFCFERRHCYDVLLGKGKIAGSAQRRTRYAVMQHGSIILANRFAQQPTATTDSTDTNFREKIAQTRTALARHFAAALRVELTAGTWSAGEAELADSLVAKYAGAEWTQRS